MQLSAKIRTGQEILARLRQNDCSHWKAVASRCAPTKSSMADVVAQRLVTEVWYASYCYHHRSFQRKEGCSPCKLSPSRWLIPFSRIRIKTATKLKSPCSGICAILWYMLRVSQCPDQRRCFQQPTCSFRFCHETSATRTTSQPSSLRYRKQGRGGGDYSLRARARDDILGDVTLLAFSFSVLINNNNDNNDPPRCLRPVVPKLRSHSKLAFTTFFCDPGVKSCASLTINLWLPDEETGYITIYIGRCYWHYRNKYINGDQEQKYRQPSRAMRQQQCHG